MESIVHLRLVEICSVVFVQICWQTNQTSTKQTQRLWQKYVEENLDSSWEPTFCSFSVKMWELGARIGTEPAPCWCLGAPSTFINHWMTFRPPVLSSSTVEAGMWIPSSPKVWMWAQRRWWKRSPPSGRQSSSVGVWPPSLKYCDPNPSPRLLLSPVCANEPHSGEAWGRKKKRSLKKKGKHLSGIKRKPSVSTRWDYTWLLMTSKRTTNLRQQIWNVNDAGVEQSELADEEDRHF